ncbi:MAG TPA: hypothetical protein VJ508_00625, partial [Saprospiraceae bacterium]|nr:hypothetical protein [Saprospiraceae bacterium]
MRYGDELISTPDEIYDSIDEWIPSSARNLTVLILKSTDALFYFTTLWTEYSFTLHSIPPKILGNKGYANSGFVKYRPAVR